MFTKERPPAAPAKGPAPGADDPAAPGAGRGRNVLAGAAAIPRTDCGDFDIRIARDGTWHYRGSPIGRPALVRLFASVLTRTPDGDYWLETPAERGRIEVEDAPFVAVEVAVTGKGRDQRLTFRTNIDQWVTAGETNPVIVREGPEGAPRPYLVLDDRLEALIARSVYYDLADLAVDVVADESGTSRSGVWSDGCFFPLDAPDASMASTPNPDAAGSDASKDND